MPAPLSWASRSAGRLFPSPVPVRPIPVPNRRRCQERERFESPFLGRPPTATERQAAISFLPRRFLSTAAPIPHRLHARESSKAWHWIGRLGVESAYSENTCTRGAARPERRSEGPNKAQS